MNYTREWVEWLMPGVWDSMRVMEAPGLYGKPDRDMPIPASDPRKSLDRVLGLADVQSAYRHGGLTHREKQVLLLRYGFDLQYSEISILLEVPQTTVYRTDTKALDKIMTYLGVDTCESVTVDWMTELDERED